jgi:tyrosyl-tRNA synthetase
MTHSKIDEHVALLMQGTEFGDENLEKAMTRELKERLEGAAAEGASLRVYAGFDPRTSDLHLGHTVPIRKMRQFQELGHEVIFLIGRFTSLIGDPSDKDKLRAQLNAEEAAHNAQTYADQAFKILDPEKTRIEYNDEWLSKLSFADLIGLAQNFTIQQFMTRENFRKRWDHGDPVYLHETFYSIMQGYDALHLKADVQIGGTDQLFNILTAARKLMESRGEKPNIGIILGILPGTDGVVKMSKSLGNHIPLRSTPEDMYGKVMSVPDTAMGAYFRLVTRWTPEQISELEKGLADGSVHPRDAKMRLAREIIAIYHGDENVEAAEGAFKKVFQQKGLPDEIETISLIGEMSLIDVIMDNKLASSRSDARRLIQQRGVRLNDVILEDVRMMISAETEGVLRVGKRRFLRLIASES